MPSLNSCNTKSRLALDIPLCGTIKPQKKYIIYWSKDLEKVNLKHKSSCNYSCNSFMHGLKKKFLITLKIKQFYWFMHGLKKKFLITLKITQFYWFLLTVDCFSLTIFLFVHTSMGTLMEIRTVFGLF